jgi:predicted enzyme related to lactoylglutathione lyase
MPDEPDPGPRWVTFVTVDDADATVAAAQDAGAQVVMPPTDMEGVGRMTIYSHPASGMMYVMQYTQPFG